MSLHQIDEKDGNCLINRPNAQVVRGQLKLCSLLLLLRWQRHKSVVSSTRIVASFQKMPNLIGPLGSFPIIDNHCAQASYLCARACAKGGA